MLRNHTQRLHTSSSYVMHLLPNPKITGTICSFSFLEQQRVKLQEALQNKLVLCSMWPQDSWLSLEKSIRNSCLHFVSFMFPAQLDPRFSVKIRMDAKWAGIEEISHMRPRTLRLVESAHESGRLEHSTSALPHVSSSLRGVCNDI